MFHYHKEIPSYYFPATNDFRLIKTYPLSDPVVTDQYVLQVASSAVLKAYNVDYIHWQQQMQDASANFTDGGWAQFVAKFRESNNLDTIRSLHMIADTSVTGAPEILQKALLPSGNYAWKIRLPILVNYISDKRTINMPLSVILVVVRQPVSQYPTRIAINNFIASSQA